MSDAPVPPNPYRDATLGDLARACARIAGELQTRRPRTPEERLALAQDATHALLAAVIRLRPGGQTPGNPEFAMRDDRRDIPEAFGAWYDRQAAELRYLTLSRAADAALGAEAVRWLIGNHDDAGGVRPGDLATASEDGLRAMLARLGEIRARRRRGATPPA